MVVHTPEINQRVHHATDEEKLASTGIKGQTTDQEEGGEPECKKAPVRKYPIDDISFMDGTFTSSNHQQSFKFKFPFDVAIVLF